MLRPNPTRCVNCVKKSHITQISAHGFTQVVNLPVAKALDCCPPRRRAQTWGKSILSASLAPALVSSGLMRLRVKPRVLGGLLQILIPLVLVVLPVD
ncbi:hypothetical protein BVC80_1513g20 [Macleaya cordata]|uniref:Uncharacterized protein n=1 Tax=Macleaya cordata TaxID=56857 RepID=A0A200PTJ6_MACCD|nr:hypothetical protein BVC80_1513g20 [Macleaya cordata]